MDDTTLRSAQLLHLRAETLHVGEPVPAPLVLASMYHLPGDPAPGIATYGRPHNPTWESLETALSHLEGAPCVAFPSGMAAIAAALFTLAQPGERVLLPSDGYYATRSLAAAHLARFGVAVTQRPTRAMAKGGFEGISVVFLESPSNPGLELCDIAAIVQAAHQAGARVVVDNTTMTPLLQRPLDLGADVVVAADTKAPGGHSDVLMGHATSRDGDLIAALRDWRTLSGCIPGPFEAWLTLRGLETLEVRMTRMCETAAVLAARLAGHPKLRALCYPGLADHPDHALAARQMTAPGFLIGLTLAGRDAAERFIAACPLIQPATSFGGVHTSAERRARWGDAVADGFVRLSVGIEPAAALIPAIETALDAA